METDKLVSRLARLVPYLALIIAIFSCTGCCCITYFGKDGPYYGRVVDKETKAPIEGVVVAGKWGTIHRGPGGAVSTYYDAYETVTDENGDFTIPGQGIQIFSNLSQLQLFVLKAGYENIDGYMWNTMERLSLGKEGDRILIGLKRLTMEERKKNSLNFRSLGGNTPISKQKRYLKEVNREHLEVRGVAPYKVED